MSFLLPALTRVAQSARNSTGSNTLWFYSRGDASATVQAAGYFNSARAILTVGDIILATVGIGGTPATLTLRVTAVPTDTSDVTVTAS